jgi:hypothetical protein
MNGHIHVVLPSQQLAARLERHVLQPCNNQTVTQAVERCAMPTQRRQATGRHESDGCFACGFTCAPPNNRAKRTTVPSPKPLSQRFKPTVS